MHAHGEIHGDIVPDHIRIRYDGTPVLLRFAGGHASAAGGPESASHPGYAPPEQYASDRAATGPWTDIYMLAATIYRTITGQPPPDATSRLNNDRYVPRPGPPRLGTGMPSSRPSTGRFAPLRGNGRNRCRRGERCCFKKILLRTHLRAV